MLLLIALTLGFPEELSPADKKTIESLIGSVEKLKGAKMIRNGTEYDGKTAARFLRGKWDTEKKGVKTVKDFLDKAATVSSTTGKPYEILFENGKKISAREFFEEELKRLEKAGGK